jgi:hypothetical protein
VVRWSKCQVARGCNIRSQENLAQWDEADERPWVRWKCFRIFLEPVAAVGPVGSLPNVAGKV